MDLEQSAFQIISYSGDAMTYAYEALDYVSSYDYKEAKESIGRARQQLLKGHQIQTNLLVDECSGNLLDNKVTIMLVHAQDHLMNSQLLIDFADKFIDVMKRRDENHG